MSAPGDALSARGRRRRVASENAFNKQLQESKRALYHCNYCQKDISNVVRIKCADCADFDLCLDCFAVGVEVAGHKRTHAYRVVDNLSFPLFHPDWGADEELLLLEAVDMYGLGNWGAVSEHVGTKPKELCKLHYYQIYIDPDSCPLPTPAPEMANIDIAKCVEEAKQGKGRKRTRFDTPAAAPPSTAGNLQAAAATAHPIKPEDQAEAPAAGPSADAGQVAAEEAGSSASEPKAEEGAAEVKAEEAGPSGGGSGEKARKRQKVQPGKEEDGSKPGDKQTSGRGVPGADGQPVAGAEGAAEGDGQVGLKLPKPGLPGAAGADGAPMQKLKSGTSITDITGYSRTRQEFETEWDNDAEQTIADLEFNPDDSEEDRAGKLRLMEIYNLRLDERERRRAFILEHDLLNLRHIQGLDRRRLQSERDQYARLRVFARYAPPKAHETFVEGLLTEERLRARIAELFEYRRQGIRTLADADDYEQERLRRPKPEPTPEFQAAPEAPATAPPSRPQGTLPPRAAHIHHTSYAVLAGLEEPPQQQVQLPPRSSGGASTSKGTKGMSGSGAMSAAAAAKEAAERQRSLSSALTAWRHRRGVPLDITGLPGVELLTSRERELCANARLLPSHYLSLKDMLMRDCDVHGLVSRSDVRGYFRLDPAKAQRIYDLLHSLGWLKGAPAPAPQQRMLPAGGIGTAAAAAGPGVQDGEQGPTENGIAGQEGQVGLASSDMQA